MHTPSHGEQTPGRLPRIVIRIASSVLPRGQVRARYQHELDAELHALPPRRRLSFALGILRRAWELRRATTRAVGPAMEVIPHQRRQLGCAINVHHRWHLERTEDGELYRRCRRCGKDDDGTLLADHATDFGYGMNITSSW